MPKVQLLPDVATILGLRFEPKGSDPLEGHLFLQYTDQRSAIHQVRVPMKEALRLYGLIEQIVQKMVTHVPPGTPKH